VVDEGRFGQVRLWFVFTTDFPHTFSKLIERVGWVKNPLPRPGT
jgi:hypothetical protein